MATVTRIAGGNISGKIDCLELEDVRIYRIADIDDIAWPARALFSRLTDEEMRNAEPLLPPGALNAARSEIRLSFNSFLIQAPNLVALIDAGKPSAFHRSGLISLSTPTSMPITSAGTRWPKVRRGGRLFDGLGMSYRWTSSSTGARSTVTLLLALSCTAPLPTACSLCLMPASLMLYRFLHRSVPG
jgi:hypothetical protein